MSRSAICVASTLTLVCTATLTCVLAVGVPRQSRKAIERMSDRVESRDRNLERALLLGLRDDLIDPGPQFEIGVAQCLLSMADSATAALPRATSFMIWLEEASLRQLVWCRCRLDGFKS